MLAPVAVYVHLQRMVLREASEQGPRTVQSGLKQKQHEREREMGRVRGETWILTSLNSSSLVILSGEHYCEQVAACVCERERDCWLMGRREESRNERRERER